MSSYYGNGLKHIIFSHKKILYIFFLLLVIIGLYYWTNPIIRYRGTVKIWDRNHILLYESAGSIGTKIPVSYEDLPAHFIHAVIASEDETFWTNPGVDIRAIVRAGISNIREGRIVSGASTITQQLVRSEVFDDAWNPRRSFLRKTREIITALRLTAMRTKKDILTLYVNAIYFGNLSYGVEAASRTYFGKSVSQLSLAESAFLAGLISSPGVYNPFLNMEDAKSRQQYVLDRMQKLNYISDEEYDLAKSEVIALRTSQDSIKAPHFVAYIVDTLKTIPTQGAHGQNVYTTLDYAAFSLAQDIASSWVSKLSRDHDLSNAALVLLENQTGKILTMLGGIDYNDASHSGQVNVATSLRQPGSALKPVTYAAAFASGFTPATRIYDVPKVYKTKKGEGFTPNNYDGVFHGVVFPRVALASSFNLPAVELLDRIGIDTFLTYARKFGISTLTNKDRYDLSLTLGGGEVTLLELTNMYASLARGGELKKPYAIERITDDSGVVIFQYSEEAPKLVFGNKSAQIAYLITDILSDASARISGFGEKNPLKLSRPAAVKTGTTTDWHDNWTVGYTPSYTVGVWVGNNDNHPMKDISGVTGAAPIWNQFLEELLKGKPKEQFSKPVGIRETEICKLTGKPASDLCPERYIEKFIDGTEPTLPDDMLHAVTIDIRNNLLATAQCDPSYTKEKVFIKYPPEIYSWARMNNQPIAPEEYSPMCATPADSDWQSSYLSIISPRAQAVFESAPEVVAHEKAVFELHVSSDIQKVTWVVDDKQTYTVSEFPFQLSWVPVIGKHRVKAIGQTRTGRDIESETVAFSVVDYKSGY